MELKIHAGSADPTFLEGKYSESFISELSRQITAAIEDAMGISGLDGSTLRLELVFAPGTYMEHTSDNVTYRRLLLSDKSCQARDFWVKWTRLDGAVAYTVSDEVSSESVRFELGEDVPQKIREREFRFLCAKNPDKYQSAMGKKTVTEWRELIKRAIRRGDVTKLESELSEAAHADDLQDKLLEVLGSFGKAVEIEKAEDNSAPSFDSIMELARAALDSSVPTANGDEPEDGPEDEPEELEGLAALEALLDAEDEAAEETEEENGAEEPDLPWLADGDDSDGLYLDLDGADEPGEESTEPAYDCIEEEELGEEATTEEAIGDDTFDDEYTYGELTPPLAEDEPEDEIGDESEDALDNEPDDVRPVITEADIRRELEERIRRELEEKIRLEYEERERDRALEAERRKREEEERLRRENERLAEMARLAEAERARHEAEKLALEEQSKREAEELRIRIEAQAEREARERDRLAEAARRAVIEQRERELEQRQKEEREREERRAQEEPEREAAPVVSEPAPIPTEYLAKHARLMFRHPADLNVITRIKEIIENTLIAEHKENLPMHMKAYPIDETTIGLDILRIPENERDLLVTMMKALGNGRLGIVKITVE